METQLGHIYEPALIIWKSPHWKAGAPKGQEMRSRRPDVFPASHSWGAGGGGAANDKPNFRRFLS